jgi:hypothetical protein
MCANGTDIAVPIGQLRTAQYVRPGGVRSWSTARLSCRQLWALMMLARRRRLEIGDVLKVLPPS